MEQTLACVLERMIKYYKGDAKRIQHFIKVHAFARAIGQKEGLNQSEQNVLEIAAYVHDIGIKKAEEMYNSCEGKLQEKLGPPIAKQLLADLIKEPCDLERICYLVGNHHTYNNINGRDYRILVEADFLVNLQEEGINKSGIEAVYNKIFATEYGKYLCKIMFDI